MFQATTAHDQLRDHESALKFGQRILKVEPGNELALAVCARQLGRIGDAGRLKTFSDEVAEMSLSPWPTRLIMSLADGLIGVDLPDLAEAWIDRAIASGEDTPQLVLRKARLLYRKGDLAGSEPLWRRLIDAPESVVCPFEPHVFLARSAMRSGDTETAVEHYREAVRLNPGHPESRDGLIAALLRDGDLPAADQANETYRKDFPNDPRPVATHLTIGYWMRDPAEVERRYQTAVNALASDIDGLIRVGRIIDGQYDHERALAHLTMLRESHPDNATFLHRQLIQQVAIGDREREARETAKTLLEIEPNHEAGLLQLATLNQRLGDLDEADRLFQHGIREFPANLGFWIGHALALMRADKVAEGRALLGKARAFSEDGDPMATADLARLAEIIDLPEEADALFDEALKLSPSSSQLWRRAVRFNLTRGAYHKTWRQACQGRTLDRRDAVITEALTKTAAVLKIMDPAWDGRTDQADGDLLVPDDLFPVIAARAWPRPAARPNSANRGAMLITSTLGSRGSERQVMFSMQAL